MESNKFDKCVAKGIISPKYPPLWPTSSRETPAPNVFIVSYKSATSSGSSPRHMSLWFTVQANLTGTFGKGELYECANCASVGFKESFQSFASWSVLFWPEKRLNS